MTQCPPNDSLYPVGFPLYHWPSPLKVYNLAQHPWLLWGHYTCSQKIYILPELCDIFLKVVPYFESCAIFLTKLNDILKVAWYFESWINITLACHIWLPTVLPLTDPLDYLWQNSTSSPLTTHRTTADQPTRLPVTKLHFKSFDSPRHYLWSTHSTTCDETALQVLWLPTAPLLTDPLDYLWRNSTSSPLTPHHTTADWPTRLPVTKQHFKSFDSHGTTADRPTRLPVTKQHFKSFDSPPLPLTDPLDYLWRNSTSSPLTPHHTTADRPTRLPVTKQHFKSFDYPPHHRWPTHSTTCDETALQVLWLPTALLLTDPLDYIWRNSTSSPLTPHGTTADRPTRLPVTKQHFKSFDSPPYHRWPTHLTTCDETALQVLWLPTTLPLTDPLDYLWRNSTSSPLTTHRTTADQPTRLPVTALQVLWLPTALLLTTTCDETALQVLWLPTALPLTDPLDYLWRNSTSSPLTPHRTHRWPTHSTTCDETALQVLWLPTHSTTCDRWLPTPLLTTHSTTCDETALQVLWLPTAPPLTNPLDYLWRNCTSSPLTPHGTTADDPLDYLWRNSTSSPLTPHRTTADLPVTKQHFKSFDSPRHYCWSTHSTTCDETALQVLWLPTLPLLTDPLDYLWRNCTSSPLTPHGTTADRPTRLPVTKQHFKSFDYPPHHRWPTHSTTCDETALQVLWLPTALLLIDPLDYLWRNSTSSPLTPTLPPLTDPLDYLWRNSTSSPLTPHHTTADRPTRLPVTKQHFKSFDYPPHHRWPTHSTTCDETALQVLWLPTALLLIDPLDYLWRNCTSSPLTPRRTTVDRPTQLLATKQHFDLWPPAHYCWLTHSTTCDETALQVLWLPTTLPLTDPLDYLWRNSTSSPLTTHRTTADQPTRLPVTKLHFKSFDSPRHYCWSTHSTTCDETALQVLWLPTAPPLTNPLDYLWRNSTSSPLTPHHTTADWPTRLPVTKQHFKSFDSPRHYCWSTHSTTCDETALQVLWLPTLPPLTDPLDYLWRNSTSSPLTPHHTTADRPTRLPVTKQHFKSFDYPPHHRWPTHSTTCDETALQVLWLPTALLLTDPLDNIWRNSTSSPLTPHGTTADDPLDYLWRNSTSSPLTPHLTTADRPTWLPVTKQHFKSFDSPPHYRWPTHSTTCDETALQVLWLPTAPPLTNPLDYLWRNCTSSPLTPHGTTADWPTRQHMTKQHFKSFDSPRHYCWSTHSTTCDETALQVLCWPTHLTTCDETALQVLWLPTTLPLTDPLDYLWRNSTSSPLTTHRTTADQPTRLPVTKLHFKSFDSPRHYCWSTHSTTCDETALQVLWLPTAPPLTNPLDYLWRNCTSSPLTPHGTTADRWLTHSTTCDETALQVLWLPTAPPLTNTLDYLWRNCTSSPLTPHGTTADWPTRQHMTKQHFKSFDSPPHYCWSTHSTTCDETALQVLWLPTDWPDYLWRNSTSSPLTPHHTTADWPTRLPVTKQHFKSFDYPPHHRWPTHSTTCDETALQVLWLPTALLLTDPLDNMTKQHFKSFDSPLLPVTKQHFKSFDSPPHHRWPTHSTTCDETALQVLWLPTAPLRWPTHSTTCDETALQVLWLPTTLPLTDPLDYLWRNSTSSPLTTHRTTADQPTRLPVTKLHFKSFDSPRHYWSTHSTTCDETALQVLWLPPHHRWPTHLTTCDETALQVLWLPTTLPLTDPLDYLWRNSTSSPLTLLTRLPVTKQHFKSFDSPPYHRWPTHLTTCDETALQVLWLPTTLLTDPLDYLWRNSTSSPLTPTAPPLTDPLDYLWRNCTSSPLTTHRTTADQPTRLPVTKLHFKSFDSPRHYCWPTHSTTCDETALQVLWLPTAPPLTNTLDYADFKSFDPLDYLWRNSTSSPLTPHLTLLLTTHSTTCDETALQVLWLPTAPPLTNPLDYLWRNSTSSPLTPHHTTADWPTRLPVTKQHFKSFDYPPHHRWPTHSTTCDETALQVLWLPTALLLTDPLDYLWRNSTSSPLTPHRTTCDETADRPTRLPVTKQHFKSFDSPTAPPLTDPLDYLWRNSTSSPLPPHYRWPTHSTTCDETALQVLWLPTTLPLTDPLDYLWRNSTSSPLTPHHTTADRPTRLLPWPPHPSDYLWRNSTSSPLTPHRTTADWPTRLPVTKQHFKSFDSPRHYCWSTHSTTCDETALQVLWLPTLPPLTDPLDYLWRNSTSSPLTPHHTTADRPTRLPVTKQHFKSFDYPPHHRWPTHSTTCDETALQVLWLPTALLLTDPLDNIWRNSTSSPLTPHGTTADRPTRLPVTKQHFKSFDSPPYHRWLDYLWRNSTSSPLTPHHTTADRPTRLPVTKQHFKSFDYPPHHRWPTHSTTCDETALQVLWLPTALLLTDPLDYLWRNSTSSPLTPHGTTADRPTRLPVTKQHFKSFDSPPHYRWPTHSTTCDETALQVLWLPTAPPLTNPLDYLLTSSPLTPHWPTHYYLWRNSTSSPLTPHHTTADRPTRLPVTKQHFKSFDYPPHHRWPTHSTTCDETALQVLWLPTALLLIDPLDYLWRNSTSSPLTTHRTTADQPTRLPVTKLHFKSFDSPPLLLTDPLDYLWRNSTSSPLTTHRTTADQPTRLPVTKLHFKSFDSPRHYCWLTHSTTYDETALQVLWLPTALLLTDPLDYLWRNSTSSPLTPHLTTTADYLWPTRLPVTKLALQVLWLPTAPPLTNPLDYLWRNCTSSPLTPHGTTADRPTRLPVTKQHFKSFDSHLTTADRPTWLPVTKQHFKSFDSPPHYRWPTHSTTCDETALQVLWLPTAPPLTNPLDYLWRNCTSSPLTPHGTTADRPTRLPVTKLHFKSFDSPLPLTDPLTTCFESFDSPPHSDWPTRLPVTKLHFKSFDSPPHYRWPTHSTTCDETALQVLWLPTAPPLTNPLDYLWRNCTSSPLTPHGTTVDRPTRLPVTKQHFKSFDYPPHHRWPTHSTTCDETALQVLWLPTTLPLTDPLDYLWRNSTSSPLTPTALLLIDPLDYLWRNSTSSPLTPHLTTADRPTWLPVTKQHFKSFDSPPHYRWPTHSTTCDETALQVLWLPTAPPLTDPLDYLWRNCTSSPLTPHGTTADWPTRQHMTKQHFKSFDSPRHYCWSTHSTTCDETALQVLWLPTLPPLTDPLDYLWRNSTSSPLTPHHTTADRPTRLPVTKQHFKSFDYPPHHRWPTHSTTCDETALQVLWLPTALLLTDPLDNIWRNSTSSPLTPHGTTADRPTRWRNSTSRPTRLPVTKQHFKSFDSPPHYRWPTHSTTCDETALQVLWLPTAPPLTNPLDYLWRNCTSSPLTPHGTTADRPTRLPVTKQHFKSFDYPPHHRWPTHSTTCDETALQVLWLPTTLPLTDPLDYLWRNSTSSPLTTHRTTAWPTHSTTCDETALQVLWLPTALLLTKQHFKSFDPLDDPLDYLWRNSTSSPLTTHRTTADQPTRLPVTKQHFKSFDSPRHYRLTHWLPVTHFDSPPHHRWLPVTKQHFKSFDSPPHYRWPTHSTTCDETALQVLWLPTAPPLTNPLDYLWRNCTSSPLTPHGTTADWPTRLPTYDETALQVLWLPTALLLIDPLDYLWRNSTSSPLTPHLTTADRPTRLPVTKQHFKSFDSPPHYRWPTHSTTCDETALQVLWLPTAPPLTNPLDYLWRNCTSSPLTPHGTTADRPTRLPVTKQHFKSFDSHRTTADQPTRLPADFKSFDSPLDYLWRNSTSSPLTTHRTTADHRLWRNCTSRPTRLPTRDETALQVLWLPTALPLTDPLDYLWRNSTSSPLTTHRTTADQPTRLPVTKQHFKSFDSPRHYCWLTHSTTCDETALQVLWLPTLPPLTDPLDYLWRNSTSSPLTPHHTTADRPTRLPVTKQHFKSFDYPPHHRWPTHSTTCDETALQVLWLPTALLLTDPLDNIWRNSTSSPLTPHGTTADRPTRLPVTKQHFKSFDSPPYHRWPTHLTTCDETALQVLWLPTTLPLTDPLDYLWRNSTSSPLTTHRTTADQPTRLPVTKLHFKSFDSPRHYCWLTHSTTYDETALQVLWLPTALLLIDPLDYLWRNSTSSPLTPHLTTADRPTWLPVTKQHFKSFDSPPHYRWPTHSTTCDETALQVLWLPTAPPLTNPLDYLWRNCTSSPLTPHGTTADRPTRLPVTKQHFKSFDYPPHHRWPTHSTTCDETALQVLWLPTTLPLTDPLDYLWRNSTSSPLTTHRTTADQHTRLPVTKLHFKSFDSPRHYCWLTHSTTCDETALQVLWLPTTLPLTDPLDYLWRNCTSSPLTPHHTTADRPTRLPVTKQHFKSFDYPPHHRWPTHSTTCDETALQVLWLPTALLLTDPLDYLWRNSTSSPLTPHHTTADRPTRLPVTTSTTCDETALQVLWLPTTLPLTDPLDYLWRNSTSSPLTPHLTTADRPTRLPVTKQHFKSFDSPPHYRWPTHSTTCDETALQVLWLPTAPPLTNPLDYLWRNCTSSPLTPHGTTADWPTRLPVTKQHFKSFDSPRHYCWSTHSTTCDETALQVLWLPTLPPLTDPLDYLWRNSTSSPLTPHHTTADRPTRLPVTKQHFKSFDYPPHHRWPTHSTTCDETALQVLWLPPHHCWPTHSTTCDETALQVLWLPTALLLTTHSTTCDETALQVLWLPTALPLTDPLDYLWRNSTSSPLTPHHTTADRPTRLPVTKQHFKSFDYPPHHRWPTHSTTCDETALQVLWLPTALLLTDPLDNMWRNSTSSPLTPHHTTADDPLDYLWRNSTSSPLTTHRTTADHPLDYLWRNSTSSPLTPHHTTADRPTRLPVTKQHFKSFDSPPYHRWPDPLDYLWRNSTSSPLTPHHTTADRPTRLPVTKQHFKSFDYPPHHRWPTHSTTCDETALQVLWLPTALLLTDPLDNIWRNSTSSPLTPHGTTADRPTRLPVTKQHFKSFDSPPYHRWPTHLTTCDETALQVLWLPTTLPLTDPLDYLWRNSTSSPLTTHRTTADQPTRLPVTKLHFKSFDSPRHYCWLTHSTTYDETALQVLWLPTALLLIDPLDYLWRNSTSSPLTPHLTTADRPTWLPVTKQHFKSFDSPPHYRWPTHSTTCDETALQVLWLPTAPPLTNPLDYLWRNCTSSPLTPHGTTADRPTRLPVTKQHFKSFDYPPHHRWPTHSTTCWPTHSTTCDETALQVLWLPTAPPLTNPLDYLWRNCTSSPLTPHGTTADWPTRQHMTKQHFKSFDSPRHYCWSTHSTTCDETALQVLWLPTAPPLTNPLDYLWRNSTSSPLTPHHTTADWPTRLPVTKQHFKSFDYPPHHRWPTHSTTCDETALQVLWLPTALLLTDPLADETDPLDYLTDETALQVLWLPTAPPLTNPLDYLWRNCTSSPLTPHGTTADDPLDYLWRNCTSSPLFPLNYLRQNSTSPLTPQTTADWPTRLPVTKLHFKSFDSPPHYRWPTHSTTCDETALQVLWLPTAPPLTNPLDYLWRNCTSSPLTPHGTTATTHSTTCDETALQVLWLPTDWPDYLWRNSTSSPLTPHHTTADWPTRLPVTKQHFKSFDSHGTTADRPTRLPVTKQHFKSFDSPPYHRWQTHLTTCDETALQVLWLPTTLPLTDPLDYLWRNSTSSPLTTHRTTADQPTRLPVTKLHFKSFDSPRHYCWLTHSTTCDETALQVLWLPTALLLIDPLDYLWRNSTSSPLTPHLPPLTWLPVTKQHFKSFDSPPHYRWPTHSTTCDETALQVLWLPTAPPLTNPLDYLWRNCTSSPLTPHGTTADWPTRQHMTKQHFKSFDSPRHYCWSTHSTTCDETALQVLWPLPPLTDPLDYLWRNSTSSPLTPHHTTADRPTRLPVTKQHFKSFDYPPHHRWPTHSTTCDETALQVLWLPTALLLIDPLDYLWRNSTSSPLTTHRTTADQPTRLPVTKLHFKSFDSPPHYRWPTHSTTCDETALQVLWLPTAPPLTNPLDYLWRNCTSSPLTPHGTTADWPTRLPVTKQHFKSFDSPPHYCRPHSLTKQHPLDYLWRNSTSSPLTPHHTTADWPTRLPVTKQHFKSFDYPPHHRWPTHSTTCDETALQVLWLPTTADYPLDNMTKQHFKSFDSPPHYRWLTHSTTCDETALQVLWLPTAPPLTDPLDYLWRNSTSSPLTPHGTTADRPTRLPVTKLHFKSFDSPRTTADSTTCDETALRVLWLPRHYCWLTHSTTCDETALQVLWLPTTLPLTDPLDYLWRNSTSSPLTPHRTTADWPTRLPVTKQHFKSFDSPRHYCWSTHSTTCDETALQVLWLPTLPPLTTHLTTCDETALQVLWLPTTLPLTDPLDYLWRNSTSSPLTTHRTTADQPTRLPVTKLHFKSFDSPRHYCWLTHSTTCDETALQVLWLPTALLLIDPLDYLWRNSTSSPLTPHLTTADRPTWLPVTKQHFKSFDSPPHYRWPTHSLTKQHFKSLPTAPPLTTCDETALQVLWLPTALLLTDPLDNIWRNSTSSPLTPHGTTADRPTRLPVTKQHFKSFDSPPYHRWPTHLTTCDETALQVLWLPTTLPLTDPLDYLWRNSTSSPLTTHRTTADQPTRLPVTKLHFKSFDSPRHYCWSTHSTTCDETALQVLWLPTAPPLTNPLDYLWRNCTSSPLTPHGTTADATHSTTCDETALQVLWLPTAPPLTNPLDYLWRNCTSSPLTPHGTTADWPTRQHMTKQHFKSFDSPPHYCWRPTRLPVTKQHFKSFDYPPHHRWPTHLTTCDETALQVLWLPTTLPLTNPLDYLWRNSTSSPLTTHRTTADQHTRLPVTKLHFKSFDSPRHYCWLTHSTTYDETALQVLWLPTTLPLTDPLDYLWRNSTSSPLTTHRTTADQPTRLPVTKLHFKSFDSPRHHCWPTHSTHSLQDYLWRN